jgi:hypothetical protein
MLLPKNFNSFILVNHYRTTNQLDLVEACVALLSRKQLHPCRYRLRCQPSCSYNVHAVNFQLVKYGVRVYYYPRELVSGFPVKDRCSIIISHVYSSSHKPESFMREYFDNPEEAKAFYDKLKGMIEEKARSDVKNI